jgi:hypothetical protein
MLRTGEAVRGGPALHGGGYPPPRIILRLLRIPGTVAEMVRDPKVVAVVRDRA